MNNANRSHINNYTLNNQDNHANFDQSTECIPIHRLLISKNYDNIVVMMPQVNKVLKNVFKIMSQANYYLQKFGIVAKRFSSEQLMSLKILGLIKNDVKVCSYISYEESKTLMATFSLNTSLKKYGSYYYANCINLNKMSNVQSGYKNDVKIQKNIDDTIDFQKIILHTIIRNDDEVVLVDSLINLIKDEDKIEIINFMRNNNILTKIVTQNLNVTDVEDDKISCNDHSEIADEHLINLNIYILNKEKIVTMPDINKIIKIAHGCAAKDTVDVHGALLRQVNYYLGKLKTQKKKFNFTQMKAVKRFGTNVGNATYCSYVYLADALKIFEIFKTFNLKFSFIFDKIIWNAPISLDEESIYKINQSKQIKKKKQNLVKTNANNFNKIKLKYYSLDDAKLIIINDLKICLLKIMDSNRLNEYMESNSFQQNIKKYKISNHSFNQIMN
ncbi:hypothetical protein MXB_3551, partial [Myxobolus squamalis]